MPALSLSRLSWVFLPRFLALRCATFAEGDCVRALVRTLWVRGEGGLESLWYALCLSLVYRAAQYTCFLRILPTYDQLLCFNTAILKLFGVKILHVEVECFLLMLSAGICCPDTHEERQVIFPVSPYIGDTYSLRGCSVPLVSEGNQLILHCRKTTCYMLHATCYILHATAPKHRPKSVWFTTTFLLHRQL